MKKQRLYRYSCNVNGEHITGTTFDTNKNNVVDDVIGNYGSNAKRIIVVWLKEDSMEYKMEMLKKTKS